MIRQSRCTGRSRRRGFSMMELIIASMLTAMLGVLLAQACVTFGRPALEVESRARITQEAILATQSLACDLGGFLADSPGRTGTSSQYNFVSPPWNLTNGSPPGSELWLNFQGASSEDLFFIRYYLDGKNLCRYNTSTTVNTTIASHVTGFTVEQDPISASNVQINITIAYRFFTATYTLIGVPPS